MTAREIVDAVPDPELPMLTVGDLGIVTSVTVDGGAVAVDLTPTYAGCPAMVAIGADVEARLRRAGWGPVTVRTVLDPPWTTDRISEAGRHKLAAAGVAPPGSVTVPVRLTPAPSVACPRCGGDSEELSAFGPTPCTSLRRCRTCREPFEHVRAR